MRSAKTQKPDYAQLTIVLLFHLLLATAPFFFTWVSEELFEFPKMLLVYSLTVLILGVWAGRMVVRQKIIFRRTRLDLPILLFLASQILSTIFSLHPRTSVFGYYTRFHGGLLSTLTYMALYYAFVSNISKKQIKSLLINLFANSILISLYAIAEHFGRSFSCVLITGQFTVDCWVQDVQNRVFATFGQPNWLAAYTIMLLPVGITLFITAKKTIWQLFYATANSLLLMTLLFTKSRSGILGLLIAVIFLFLGQIVLFFQKKIKIHQFLNLKLATFSLLIAVILLVFGSPWTPNLQQIYRRLYRIDFPTASNSAVPVEIGGTESGDIRKIVWQGAIKVWRRYPIFGSGVETFAYSYYQDRPAAHNLVSEWDFLYNKAHNEFLNFAATTGTVGLLAYLFLLSYYLLTIIKRANLLNLSFAAAVIALSISNFFGFSTVLVTVLMWLFFAITQILNQKTKTELISKKSHLSLEHYLTITVIVIVGLYFLGKTTNIWLADRDYARAKNLSQVGYLGESIPLLQTAIKKSPQEALYYDELANTYAKAAVALANENEANSAAQLADLAISSSKKTLQLNSVHLNFYKTRIRLLSNLGSINPKFFAEAINFTQAAIKLAPTDAKLFYNLALIQIVNGQKEEAVFSLKKAIELKANYLEAREKLVDIIGE